MSSIILGIPLIIAVASQIRTKKYHAYLYWGTITLTTLTGTTLADFFDRSLGIGYFGGSLSLLALVMITLAAWQKILGSIDISTVNSTKAEAFYWTAIMFSQTLGTALGDWMADDTGLGYNGSALLIAGLLCVIVGLYYFARFSRVKLFWAAFILTRPLGATLANSLDKPISQGGLQINDITISIALIVLMLLAMWAIPQRKIC